MAANNFTGTTNSNWNVATNWSLGTVPTATDGNTATFTSSSPACTVNVASVCNNVDFTNYTHNITFTNNLTVSGNITLGTSMTSSGSGYLAINTNSTITSNGKVWTNQIYCNTTGITITISDSLTVSGTLFLSATSITVNGGTLTSQGLSQVVITGSSTYVYGSGSSVSSFTNKFTSMTVQIAAGSGTFTCSSLGINLSSCTFTYVSGTVVFTNTLNISGTCTLNLNSSNSNSTTNTSGCNPGTVTFGGGTITLSSNLCAVTNCTFAASVTTTLNGYTMYLSGNIALGTNLGNPCIIGTTAWVYCGTGTISMGTSNSGGFGAASFTINTTGTVTFQSGQTFIFNSTYNSITQYITYTAGTVVTTGSTLSLTTTPTYPVVLNTSGISWNAVYLASGGTIGVTINSTLTATTLTTVVPISGGNWSVTFSGTAGFNVGTFTYIPTIVPSGTMTVTLQSSVTYTVNTNLTLNGTNLKSITLNASTPGTQANLVLSQGATQLVCYVNATDINSSVGQTIWDFGNPTLSNTLNWNNLSSSAMQSAKAFIL